MARVEILKNTVHPFYGEVKKGEVLKMSAEYLRDYEKAGLGKESDDEYTRPKSELEN